MRKIGEILRGGAFERYLSSQEAAVDYVDERVDGRGRIQYLDSMGSVSALIEVEDLYAHVTDQLILEQSERFRNGS